MHVLLDAVRQLPNDAYEVQIHGDPRISPEYVAGLKRQTNGLPVHFRGAFDDTQRSATYAGIDLLVVPSLWLENSPLVIHEAFQASVPVVASRMGGHVDLIDDGAHGRLYQPESSDELAGILRSVIEVPAMLTSWAAKLPAIKTIDADAREWERVYLDAAALPFDVAQRSPEGNRGTRPATGAGIRGSTS